MTDILVETSWLSPRLKDAAPQGVLEQVMGARMKQGANQASFSTLSRPHSSHWGAFSAHRTEDQLIIVPHARDSDPSPLLRNIEAGMRHRTRVTQPMVRKGWLEGGPGPTNARGSDVYIPVSWPRALDLVARELTRVHEKHGAAAIYGGSYGWSSAGRFHHAQSQLHRFLNTIGG